MVIQEHLKRSAVGRLSAPAAPNTGAREMLKRLVHNGKFWFGHAADPGPLTIVIVGALGLGFLVAEGAVRRRKASRMSLRS